MRANLGAEQTARSKSMRGVMVSSFEVSSPLEIDLMNATAELTQGRKSTPRNFEMIAHVPQPLKLYALDATEMDGSFSTGNLFSDKLPREARVALTRGTVNERRNSIIKRFPFVEVSQPGGHSCSTAGTHICGRNWSSGTSPRPSRGPSNAMHHVQAWGERECGRIRWQQTPYHSVLGLLASDGGVQPEITVIVASVSYGRLCP